MNPQNRLQDLTKYGEELVVQCGSTGAGILGVVDELLKKTRIGGDIDPNDEREIIVTWCQVAHSLVNGGAPFQAIGVGCRS